MQPNNNRPVYIVQPSNITHLNVRPTIITTGAQQLQPPQAPVYQLSTIRQPVTSPSQQQQQQASSFYQVQGQPRLVSSSPVYASLLATQRFAPSSQTLLTGTPNLSPRLLNSQTVRMPINPAQSTSLLRSTTPTVSSPIVSTSASTASPTPAAPAAASTTTAAPGSKEFAVRVPK